MEKLQSNNQFHHVFEKNRGVSWLCYHDTNLASVIVLASS